MKSFKEHINPNKEHINTNKREVLKETDPLDDLTAVLGIAAAGLGAWGLKKGWDRFGKDAVASIPFVGRLTGGKAGKAEREKERKDKKIADLKKVADTGDAGAEKKLDKLLSPGEKEDRRKERLDKAKKDGDQATVDKLSTDDEKDQAKIDADDKEKKGKQTKADAAAVGFDKDCLLYTSPSPRDS